MQVVFDAEMIIWKLMPMYSVHVCAQTTMDSATLLWPVKNVRPILYII